MRRHDLAILMTCHNRREKTLRCLGSLLAQRDELVGPWNLHVFLVDDGSSDGTAEAVREWAKLHCRPPALDLDLIAGTGDLYWARGMALAWRVALGREALRCEDKNIISPTPTQNSNLHFSHFLWLNDDVVLKPDALCGIAEDARRCAGGVIVGACSERDDERTSSYGATTHDDVRIFPNGSPQLADGWFNGNFVLIPRTAWERVGIISDSYTHARADYDYAESLKNAGIPFYCASRFVGTCEPRTEWGLHGKSLFGRLAMLFKPGYCNLHDMWIYRWRHHGVMRAIVSCVHLAWNVL